MNENSISIEQVYTLIEQLMQTHAHAVNKVNNVGFARNLRYEELGEAKAILSIVNTIIDMIE